MTTPGAQPTSSSRPPRVVHWGLFVLALRGVLTPRRLAMWLAVLIVLACRDWAPTYALLGSDSIDLRAEALARAFTRSGIWTGTCIVLVPSLVLHAARVSARWRTKDELWLGARGIGRTAIVCSAWLGVWIGSVVLVVCTGLFIEALLPEAGASLVLQRSLPLTELGWVSGAHPARWTIPDGAVSSLPTNSRVRLELGLGSGVGSASEAIFRARRVVSAQDPDEARNESSWTTTARQRIATQGAIELALPPGSGAIELELLCADPDARFFVLSRAAEIWAPERSERAASMSVALQSILALCTWTALAIMLGSMLRPWLAALLVAALWIAIWLTDGVPSSCPGSTLPLALEFAGHGRVPPATTLLAFLMALISAAGALALGRTAWGAWWTRA